MENKLYVGNLAYGVTEDDLQELFSQAGTVSSVTLIKDRDTGRSKGFGFVEMATTEEAQNAINTLNGTQFQERSIVVNLARPREERGPRGGGGGGRGRQRGGRGGGGGWGGGRGNRY